MTGADQPPVSGEGSSRGHGDLPLFRVIHSKLQSRPLGRVALLYLITSYILLQIFDLFAQLLQLPHWAGRAVVAIAVLGFPVVLLFAWAFEATSPASGESSNPALLRRRLNLAILVGGALCIAYIAISHVRGGFASHQAAVSEDGSVQAATQTPSIAVLPFADLSEKRDQQYFSEGLAEELIDLLAHTEGLRVIARTSSFVFRDPGTELAEIARQLSVSNILTGSVRKAGNRIRVTTQLVQPSTGEALWSQTYDRDLQDIFQVQDEIAGAVVAALKVRLADGRAFADLHGTRNPEAYGEFLICRKLIETSHGIDDIVKAIARCETAIRMDAGYADAHAELAVALLTKGDMTGDRNAFTLALASADRAVKLGPTRAAGYSARAYLRAFNLLWADALRDSERAMELAPEDSVARLRHANLLLTLGRFAEANADLRHLVQLDPLYSRGWFLLGRSYLVLGDTHQAELAFGRAYEIADNAANSIDGMASFALLHGRPDEALALFRRLDAADSWTLSGVAMSEHSLGHHEASARALDELKRDSAASAAYQIAEIHAWRGEKDEAFAWLERAWRQRDPGLGAIKWDPFLASIRNDERYVQLLVKLGLPR